MKKLISMFTIAACTVNLMGCSTPQNQAVQESRSSQATNSNAQEIPATNAKTSKVEAVQTNVQAISNNPKETLKSRLQVGTVKKIEQGDLLCYITLADKNNVETTVGASFKLCENPALFLNKQVRAVYEEASVNDCQSAEPCGKSRKELIITKLEILNAETSAQQTNTKTISNGNWTVTIANINSWSGVNGTGNLSYHGCDSQGKCIDLTNGTISCRNGICVTGWKNGDYVYAIAEPISESTQSQPSKTTLTVRKNDTEILRETGFSVVR